MNKYAKQNSSNKSPSSPATPSSRIKIGVVGARGYSGLELCRLLLQHPLRPELRLYAHENQFALTDYLFHPSAREVSTCAIEDLMSQTSELQTVFLATPAETSLNLAPALIEKGVDVIDLSGAFRLSPEDYPQWYQFHHTASEYSARALYGLVPWAPPWSSELELTTSHKKGRLVANPGCYATSVLMALLPLLKDSLIETDNIVIHAQSGTTGAGKKPSESLLFSEVEGDCRAYKIGTHQHLPEICRYALRYSGHPIDPFFTTYLLSISRGLISTLQARVKPEVTIDHIQKSYQTHYHHYALVDHCEVDPHRPHLLSLKAVVGSPRVHLRYHLENTKLSVFSLIDNLLKGAASQALENFNRLYDFPVTQALLEKEVSP